MDEMQVLTTMLDSLSDQMKAQGELLASKIKYGDRQVEALVTLASDRHTFLVQEVAELRKEVEALKAARDYDHERQLANTRDLVIKAVGWILVVVIALVGWLVR